MPPLEKPDKNQDSGFDNVTEAFAPGELNAFDGEPQYGYRNESIPEKYQNILKALCTKIASRDQWARLSEVRQAATQAFYWRSMFDVTYNGANQTWDMPQQSNGSSYNYNNDSGNESLHYAFNFYQSKGLDFITLAGVTPEIRFKARGQAPISSKTATSANCLKETWVYQNNMDEMSQQVAKLMYTDGRVGLYTRWVTDGARFGYDEEPVIEEPQEGLGEGENPPKKKPRKPKGGEVTTAHGVLQVKVPINMRKKSDFPFVQLSYEIDLTSAKAMYPHIAKKLTGGSPGPGEYNFDRTTRIAVTQGVRLLQETGDTVEQLPTYQRTWMRPSMFMDIESEDDRTWMTDNYSDGCMVAFVGETYAESRNEAIDDHWSFIYPIQGDGQSTPSIGYVMLDVQDACNDMTDLTMTTYMMCIPAVWMDKDLFDFPAMSKQVAGPGARWPLKNVGDKKVIDSVWVEDAPKLDAGASSFYAQLMSDIPSGLLGIFPTTVGSGDPSNETKGGILAMRDAARGRQGCPWRAYRQAYIESATQAVRLGAHHRQADANDENVIKIWNPKTKEVEINLEDLRSGDYYCEAEGDESFPQTYTEKQQAFQALAASAATGNQQAVALLSDSTNAKIFKELIGIPGINVPGAHESEKQLQEIQELLEEAPIPNSDVMKQWRRGLIPKPPTEQLYKPSIGIDVDFDNHALEFAAGVEWINSPVGQENKHNNEDGFTNVRLHLLLHKAEMDKAQTNQMLTTGKVLEGKLAIETKDKIQHDSAKSKLDMAEEAQKEQAELNKDIKMEVLKASLGK